MGKPPFGRLSAAHGIQKVVVALGAIQFFQQKLHGVHRREGAEKLAQNAYPVEMEAERLARADREDEEQE